MEVKVEQACLCAKEVFVDLYITGLEVEFLSTLSNEVSESSHIRARQIFQLLHYNYCYHMNECQMMKLVVIKLY